MTFFFLVDDNGLFMDNELQAINGTITIPTSDTVTRGTSTHTATGLGRWITFTTANMELTNSTNFIIQLKNQAVNGTLYASGTVAESTTFSLGSVFPLYGTVDVVAVAEGTQSAAKTIPYTIFYETYI